ncbi:D-sedoheptulose 7-phosphate isomerase [Bosea sp. (in: a-proteobacteria)]|jgi:D-sedoheptulose 7-phosphate isomerase|uniref:D-sedoheptulose-7-phosphate isomerase n=1 Tax=Bosea sp. (in: a-proteobacteria) TaxID=1871050 RepID=UPI002DDC9AAF|nr:D-sedoheptulose 7-phosphate isomerase [Bosea sp. (in: a-proteobacteria)]HEV2508989.1 D-sedoheptulose 7-phosphate isomerase [Bosea sp. (in: a-proteobacteria)]
MQSEVEAYFTTVADNFTRLAPLAPAVVSCAGILVAALKAGRKIILCGNGGSAADAQHLAAELMGRFLKDRRPLPALALTVDTSALTAIGNDYGFDQVFARQLRGIGVAGDVLIGISTSGNSVNVVKALETARALGISTVGMTGSGGGAMTSLCDMCLKVPSDQTNHIQEMHIAIGHLLCGIVENELC